MAAPKNEVLILLHGLASHGSVCWLLSRRLGRLGHAVETWNYPSLAQPIDALGRWLSTRLQDLDTSTQIDRYHIVAHSMGAIIVREVLTYGCPEKLGRIVMLAPPNHGSRVASIASRILRGGCRPLNQLTDAVDSFVNQLAEPYGHEVGVIAAERDRVVSLASTRLKCQRDHFVLPGSHTGLLFRSDTARVVDSFVRHGHFDRTCVSNHSQSQFTASSDPAR